MITESLLGFAIWLVRQVVSLFPSGSWTMDFSPLRTVGEWFGAASAPIDLPFLLQVLAFWMTAEGLLYTARTSVWIYKRVRGG